MDHRLPTLAGHAGSLELCGYCPKLCRAACPVSDAEPRESLTPWGKMSLAWFAARGDVEADSDLAATAWACTGCFACRERCDHRNQVAVTLGAARAAFAGLGLEPAAARRVRDEHPAKLAEASRSLTELSKLPGVSADAPTALLLGCSYARDLPEIARSAIRVAVAVCGPVRLVDGCCGAPLLHAGDHEGFGRAQAELARTVAGAPLVVVDPGCALVLAESGARTLIERAAERLELFQPLADLERWAVRWQDPCQLGRGLGQYDPPRALLGRVLGRAPEEFARNREQAVCTGAGGLLPVTMPEVSARIAASKLSEHAALGGGTLVTACPSGMRRLRGQGTQVVDLMTLLADGLTRDDG